MLPSFRYTHLIATLSDVFCFLARITKLLYPACSKELKTYPSLSRDSGRVFHSSYKSGRDSSEITFSISAGFRASVMDIKLENKTCFVIVLLLFIVIFFLKLHELRFHMRHINLKKSSYLEFTCNMCFIFQELNSFFS